MGRPGREATEQESGDKGADGGREPELDPTHPIGDTLRQKHNTSHTQCVRARKRDFKLRETICPGDRLTGARLLPHAQLRMEGRATHLMVFCELTQAMRAMQRGAANPPQENRQSKPRAAVAMTSSVTSSELSWSI